jgi:hypothetical protein
MSTTKEKIAVMQGSCDGKDVQFKRRVDDSCWFDCVLSQPNWDWDTYDYRLKPEPFKLWVIDFEGNTNKLLCGWRTKEAAEDHLNLHLHRDSKDYQIKEFQEVLS